jgi:hypothetical protein
VQQTSRQHTIVVASVAPTRRVKTMHKESKHIWVLCTQLKENNKYTGNTEQHYNEQCIGSIVGNGNYSMPAQESKS